MITAVDTSALLAIAKGEPPARRWAAALEKARARGQLVICDVVAAELYAYWRDEAAYVAFIAGLGLTFLAVNESAAREAGRIFAIYRQSGGPREYLIPRIFWWRRTRCGKAINSRRSIAAICGPTFPSSKCSMPSQRDVMHTSALTLHFHLLSSGLHPVPRRQSTPRCLPA